MAADGPIYHKYDVSRRDGAESCEGSKHYGGCRLFVLDLDHDPYARFAAFAYASACEGTHPTLAAELMALAGGPCRACDGIGAVRAYGPIDDHEVCPDCGGTGWSSS